MGSALYNEMLQFNYGDADRAGLMYDVWKGTPWMVNAYTGSHHEQRERDMMEWCHAEFGDEAHPIHGMPGRWHRGGATIHGWTWFGFSTEEEMEKFAERWPAPARINAQSTNGDEE